MKKMDKKNLAIVVLSLIIVGYAGFYMFGQDIENIYRRWQYPDNNNNSYADEVAVAGEYYGHPEAAVADAAYSCDGLYFYGDIGYMTKGALLDKSASAAYDRIPDTVQVIRYGEQIEQAEQKGVSFYNTNAHFHPIRTYGDNHPLTAYLRLAEQGKVEHLKILPNERGSLEVADECDFKDKYGNYFDAKDERMRQTPLAVKEALSEYFKSDEGSKFTFVNDRRNPAQVYQLATFTGLNQYSNQPNQELAVVLTEKSSTGSIRERMMVVGFDDKNLKGSILFNEIFYSKILFTIHKAPSTLPAEAASLGKFVSPTTQLIEVKAKSEGSIYLYYDDEFDTMIRKTFPKEGEEELGCDQC